MGSYSICSENPNTDGGYVPKSYAIKHPLGTTPMSRPSLWAPKVASLIQGGNSAAALAQIKVAPSVKDLQDLRKLLGQAQLLAKHPAIDQATADQIVALSAPRLHRSP